MDSCGGGRCGAAKVGLERTIETSFEEGRGGGDRLWQCNWQQSARVGSGTVVSERDGRVPNAIVVVRTNSHVNLSVVQGRHLSSPAVFILLPGVFALGGTA
jgi:hypothetical protein